MPFYTTKKEERKENNKHGSPDKPGGIKHIAL